MIYSESIMRILRYAIDLSQLICHSIQEKIKMFGERDQERFFFLPFFSRKGAFEF